MRRTRTSGRCSGCLQKSSATPTEATSSTANVTLMIRLLRGSWKYRVRTAPMSSQAMLTAAMMMASTAILAATSRSSRRSDQHEAGEQRRHRGIALGIDQRQGDAGEKGRLAPLLARLGQRRRGGDAIGEIGEIGARQADHDRRRARQRQQQADDPGGGDRHHAHHAEVDPGHVAEAAARAEGGAGGGEAERGRAGAAGQRQSRQDEAEQPFQVPVPVSRWQRDNVTLCDRAAS